jgi:hypothetical protein
MGLFERLLPPRKPRRWERPHAVLPGLVGEELMVAHSDAAAVFIAGLAGYPTGFDFWLRVMLRREKPFGRRIDPFVALHSAPGRREFLRLSVQFADGTMISNLDRPPFVVPDAEPAGPLLVENGGFGEELRLDLSYWVWRLPPPGAITFVCHWPACGIEDARAQIDAQRIHDAASRSIDLWPGDPEPSL